MAQPAIQESVKTKRTIVHSLTLSITLGFFYVVLNWYSVSENGSDILLKGFSLLIGLFIVGAFGLVIHLAFKLIGAIFGFKIEDRSALVREAAFSGISIVVILLSFNIASHVRLSGYKVIAMNGQPIITAIDRFESENHVLPSKLMDLTPRFLSNVPNTGVAAYPIYNYIPNQSPSRFGGNSWILTVRVSTSLANCDVLIFYPNQAYPEDAAGRDVTRIENWALIQEGPVGAKEDGFLISEKDAQ